MIWTSEQQRAINDNGNLIISAAAGSGKTAVLSERIARLIIEGAETGEFLCVTFTKAAAGEMKKRIEKRLINAALEAADEKQRARLNDAAMSLGKANISTMHSFCNSILARHFHGAGLDPKFRVGDEAETLILRHEAFDDVAERRYAMEGEKFVELVDRLGGNESIVCELILGLYLFLIAQANPLGWLKTAVEAYKTDAETLNNSAAVKELVISAKRAIESQCDILNSYRDDLRFDAPKTAAHIDGELARVRALLLCDDYASYRNTLEFDPFKKIPWKGVETGLRYVCEKARNDLKKLIKKHRENHFANSLEYEARRLNAQYPYLCELYETMEDFFETYSAMKQERTIIDYGDMEHLAKNLLERPHIADEYKRRFKYIFIDEYQDTNRVQESIINNIRREGGLFLVGDVKQSIYRFRMAEPAIFMERYDEFSRNEGGKRIELNANFRSGAGVIDAVNGLFSKIMRRASMEIEYDKSAALILGRTDEAAQTIGAVELHIADLGLDAVDDDDNADDDDNEDEGEKLDRVEAEAHIAAQRIHELMESMTIPSASSPTGQRALKYSDIAVLMRSNINAADVWVQTLTLAGIPAYAELKGGFFDAVEVKVFLSLLRVIDNRRQDIPLAAVLRSPIGGFTTEELVLLRANRKGDHPRPPDESCLDSLLFAAEEGGDLGKKAEEILKKLDEWHEWSNLLSVEELIGLLLDETGYAVFCRALNGGKQREANLNALCEKARTYECGGAQGLGTFIDFMDKIDSTGSLGVAQTAGADVVRILTVHGSKGLEFPVVIFAGLDKKFNFKDTAKALVFNNELGLGARLINGNVREGSIYQKAIASRIRRKSVAEEMRILYVAMTRAKEKLILITATADARKRIMEGRLLLSEARAATAERFSQWIIGAVMQSRDGDALCERYSFMPKRVASPMGIVTKIHQAAYGTILDKRLPKQKYEEFTRAARTCGDDVYALLFGRSYAFEADTLIPSKLSVSGLGAREAELTDMPRFDSESGVSSLDRGSAAHILLRHIALRKHDHSSVRAELTRLVEAGIMEQSQADTVFIKSIVGFFNSDLGQRLLHSNEVNREVEFTHRVKASELIETTTHEPILLQGVIDCCFIEDGAWVLIDYKTDFIPKDVPPESFAHKHKRQVKLYANALAELTGRNVKERVVFLLYTGDSVQV